MMRLQLIACGVLRTEAYFCAATSPNIVDIVFMQQGLHNDPDLLREEVQRALGRTADSKGNPYEASLLGYGLCSNGIVGLSASIPVVVPRGHDCITLLLGSRQRYQEYFEACKGVYWYSSGWIETETQPGPQRQSRLLAEYTDKYGRDNARYLMQIEQDWIRQYSRATYIDWGLPGSEEQKRYTRRCAEHLGWQYDQVKGDPGMMQRLVDGRWDESEFLVIQPGQCIGENLTGEGIICAEASDS